MVQPSPNKDVYGCHYPGNMADGTCFWYWLYHGDSVEPILQSIVLIPFYLWDRKSCKMDPPLHTHVCAH